VLTKRIAKAMVAAVDQMVFFQNMISLKTKSEAYSTTCPSFLSSLNTTSRQTFVDSINASHYTHS
jgi:hypothetical protein